MSKTIARFLEKTKETLQEALESKRVPVPEEAKQMIEALGQSEDDAICFENKAGEVCVLLDEEKMDVVLGVMEKFGAVHEEEDQGDYPDVAPNQFDNMTGSMNL